jgi:hypothetical protein
MAVGFVKARRWAKNSVTVLPLDALRYFSGKYRKDDCCTTSSETFSLDIIHSLDVRDGARALAPTPNLSNRTRN